jgi:hypothetical protein
MTVMFVDKDIIYQLVSTHRVRLSPINACRARRETHSFGCRQAQDWEVRKSTSALGYCAATMAVCPVQGSFKQIPFSQALCCTPNGKLSNALHPIVLVRRSWGWGNISHDRSLSSLRPSRNTSIVSKQVEISRMPAQSSAKE